MYSIIFRIFTCWTFFESYGGLISKTRNHRSLGILSSLLRDIAVLFRINTSTVQFARLLRSCWDKRRQQCYMMRMAYDQEMIDLASELFRVFAQFEYCLKATGYCVEGAGDGANPDWQRFARELSALTEETGADVIEAVSHILRHPPRKQVYVGGALQWRDAAPAAENENDLILLYVRRVRNNLFHGGKFNGRFFDPERSRKLLQHSITILMASILMSPPMLEAYEHRTD